MSVRSQTRINTISMSLCHCLYSIVFPLVGWGLNIPKACLRARDTVIFCLCGRWKSAAPPCFVFYFRLKDSRLDCPEHVRNYFWGDVMAPFLRFLQPPKLLVEFHSSRPERVACPLPVALSKWAAKMGGPRLRCLGSYKNTGVIARKFDPWVW